MAVFNVKKAAWKVIVLFKAYFALLNMSPAAAGRIHGRGMNPDDEKSSPWIHIILFIVTFITTTLAGSSNFNSAADIILSGLPFSASIMGILLAHEMGHYLAARHFGVRATLPYFIPFPSMIGTMGAVIKIKSRIPDRRSLLYIGALGPAVGFVLSLSAAVIGIYLSEIKALPANTGGLVPIFGDSILFSVLTKAIHGSIPPGQDIYLSPYAWAGWIGFLVTSLNLMPVGQLDGSHIVYALLGRKQVFFGWAAFAGLAVLSFFWPGWIVWIVMSLAFLMIGHPPIEGDEEIKLSAGERILGWSCMAVFFLTFIPVPFEFI